MVELDFDDDLTLILEDDMPPEGLKVVYVVESWRVQDDDYVGDIDALAFKVVDSERAAVAWFDDVRISRPWETRQ